MTEKAIPALILGAALSLALACTPGEARYREVSPTRIRAACESAGDHPTATALREASRIAEAASRGRVRVRVYENGSLGAEAELIEQLRFGGVDVAAVGVRALESVSSAAAALGRPGRFPDAASLRAAFEGAEGNELRRELEGEKLFLIAWYDGGPECLLLPPARTGTDIAGLRIGVEKAAEAMRELAGTGAIPVPVSGTEVRRALETGLIEGLRAPLAFIVSSRLYTEYLVRAMGGYRVPVVVAGSRVSFMKMPENERRAACEAFGEARKYHDDALSFIEGRFAAAEKKAE